MADLVREGKSIAKGTFDSSMNYMNLGFTLTAALAWHEFAKSLMKAYVSKGNSRQSMIMYPLLVTLITILVFHVSKMVNPSTKRPMVVPVVSA